VEFLGKAKKAEPGIDQEEQTEKPGDDEGVETPF